MRVYRDIRPGEYFENRHCDPIAGRTLPGFLKYHLPHRAYFLAYQDRQCVTTIDRFASVHQESWPARYTESPGATGRSAKAQTGLYKMACPDFPDLTHLFFPNFIERFTIDAQSGSGSGFQAAYAYFNAAGFAITIAS